MNEHDVVLLEDGRKGTIIHLFPDKETAQVETEDNKLVIAKLSTLKPRTE